MSTHLLTIKGATLSVVYGTEQPRGATLGRQQDPLWTTGGRSVVLFFNGNNHSTWRSASYRGKKSNLLEPTRLTSFMARASTIKSLSVSIYASLARDEKTSEKTKGCESFRVHI
ncbi:unnamed protein product [Ectocarpus sp. 12 AP-2014]